jgi:hypothetical protein
VKRIRCFIIVFLVFGTIAFGQSPPDLPSRTGTVLTPIITLSFGAFIPTSNGTVKVDCSGSRLASGGVYLYNNGDVPVHAAMFEFKICPGRTVTVTYPTSVLIYGMDNIGNSVGPMTLNNLTFTIDGRAPDSQSSGMFSFASNKGCNEVHYIYMGGTLNVSSSSAKPGRYNTVSVPLNIMLQ